MSTTVLHGATVIVKAKAAADSGNPTAVGLQRSVEITKDCEMREKASNTASYREYRAGRKGWQIMVSGLMSSLSDMLSEGTLYTVQVTDGSVTIQGTGYCSQVKATCTIGNLAQQSAVFQGSGALSELSSS